VQNHLIKPFQAVKDLAETEKAIKELPRVPTKSKPEHFTWTVLHQIRGVPLKDLAEHDGIALATVKNAVMGLKARLGIGLPKGRPKRKSYRPNTPGSPE
jgi:DNA-directed RNA polymerase specialized sigma24 family protein